MCIYDNVFTISKEFLVDDILRSPLENDSFICIFSFPASYRVKKRCLACCFSGYFVFLNKRIKVKAGIVCNNSVHSQSATCCDLFSNLIFAVFNETCCIINRFFFSLIFSFIRNSLRIGSFLIKNLFPCVFYFIEVCQT